MLGSGVLNVRKLMRKKIKVGLGTDVAGGYSTSILDAARQAIIASRCISFNEKDETGQYYEALSIDVSPGQGSFLSTLSSLSSLTYLEMYTQEVFYLATQGGADVLGLGHAIGNFEVGKYMDALVVDPETEDGPMDMFDGEVSDHKASVVSQSGG